MARIPISSAMSFQFAFYELLPLTNLQIRLLAAFIEAATAWRCLTAVFAGASLI
jgi:hypothetical protein